MKIVVVSDNHGYDKPLDNIIKQNPDAKFFIHCGDSEMPEQLLSNFYAVRGNNDGFYDYPESIILDLDANNKAMIIHGHRHIVYRDLTYLANFAKTKGCNIVFYGHTHIFNDEVCDGFEVHEDLLKIVNETLPEETELYDLAELFKVFGDSTRIRILFVLFEAEVCVCDLAKVLNMTQSAISHQLRILKQNKLVKSRREGKSIFYSLADDHVRTIINQGRDHIEED